jgi:L-alanine-DL-glutamate epimerase-like enolase superfamily enzyme
MAATLHAMVAVDNCPMVEYPYDPPFLTPEYNQFFVHEPLPIDAEGCVSAPTQPGLGITLRQERLA